MSGSAILYSRPRTPSTMPQVGLLGLGNMGFLMARNLANHLATIPGAPPLLVYNRTASNCEKLVSEVGEEKVKVARNPNQLVAECDVIVTNLAPDAVVKSVYEQFASFLHSICRPDVASIEYEPILKRRIFVETSTIYPTLAGELNSLISRVPDASLITCPVFGNPLVADKAQLVLIMSGDYRSKKEVAHLLVPAVGRKVLDLGEDVEKAPTFKLIGNSMILGSLEIMAESMTLAEKSGIGSEMVHTLIKDLFPAPILVAYSEKMARDLFDGTKGFSIDGGIKDASHIRRLTEERNAPMPTIDIAHQHLVTARALHTAQEIEGKEQHEVLDWSALIAGPRVAAGLDPFNSQMNSSLVREG